MLTIEFTVWPAGAESVPGAPAALAVAVAVLVAALVAEKVAGPFAVTFRLVVAVVVSVAKVRAIAAPTAAVVPAVVPPELLFVAPVWMAVAESAPTVSAPPVPSCAVVLLLAIAIATDGLTAVPPLAPAVAVEVMVSLELAVRVKLFAPVSCAEFATTACVVLVEMFKASDAPTPALPPEATLPADGTAVAASVTLFWALNVVVLLLRMETLEDDGTDAVLVLETKFSASEPATPMAMPDAPEVAEAESL